MAQSETRFAAKVWAGHWRILSESVIWWPVVVLSSLLIAFWGRRWWSKALFCLACFAGIQLLLPELYAWHDYYYVANTLFLLVALGLAGTSFFDTRLPRWIGGAILVGMFAGQVVFYVRQYFPDKAR